MQDSYRFFYTWPFNHFFSLYDIGIQMAAISGVRESFRLQKLLRTNTSDIVRGVRMTDEPQALNAYLYTIVRGSRQFRRGLLQSLLKLFEDMSVSASRFFRIFLQTLSNCLVCRKLPSKNYFMWLIILPTSLISRRMNRFTLSTMSTWSCQSRAPVSCKLSKR